MSRLDFAGKTAIVTGAASGIGAALARNLAQRGCNLVLADVNAEGLEAVAAELRSNDRRVTTHVVDVSDEAAINAFADEVRKTHGEAHLLFNNAGVALGGSFDQVTAEQFDRVININLQGVIRMTRAFLPLIRETGEGHITNISSIYGVIAPAGQTAYSAAKFGVRGFTMALRHELADTPIGVTTVHPGGIATNIAKKAERGAGVSDEEYEQGQKIADQALIMPPPKAADIILRGVERRKPRVFVGRDAHTIMWMERILPTRYWNIIRKRLDAAAT
ncbi:SDR family NAD(P)-dependent oxidoreductase [Hyphobacterium sp. HN65]|uniref:SDR family NAD(P)-dependent oxidoreductase n=1 Tax=Hyphobacterium lacteum TaxID=3116575 RepID=A0ABU7LRR6_9PROT|nr:SDR family NAD(P)-dependent oxidoreductase [Hyphobacterium sp. HN65]MEE2526603.1 SDR family NAD(P)-dependent oxidoreductase [Hyphobacterium sp. HN65]